MASKNQKSISVSQAHYKRIFELAKRSGVSIADLVNVAVDRALTATPTPAPATPAPAPTPIESLDSSSPVEIEVSDATALAVKAIDATVVRYSRELEVLTSPAFEAAIEAAIARFEAAPPVNRSCAICTAMIDSIENIEERELRATFERRLFLSDDGVYVWICARCDEQHPRDPDAPRFDGGRNADADPVLSLATGGNLAERGRVQVRKGRS